ncbi:hypothetical protein HDV04_005502 [Boothiomyces sp. JEL0838]|nr:hypothetical protein HDV04_005502 [Boothiomyces sp. JEL0838]
MKCSSILGFMGVLAMIAVSNFNSDDSFKNPTGRLVLAITFTDFFDSITKFIGQWGPDSGLTSALCYWQAWSIQQFNITSIILGLLMGLNTVYLIYFKGSVDTIQKFEPYMILASFAIPVPLALYPLFAKPTGVSMIGDVDNWCWISKSLPVYQISLWFGILWTIFLLNLLMLGITVWTIKKNEHSFNQLIQSNTKTSFGAYIQKRMLAYLIGFIIVWLPTSVNRIVQIALGNQVFAVGIIHAMLTPTRGFIDFCAYFYTWWHSPANVGDHKMSMGMSSIVGSSKEKDSEFQIWSHSIWTSPSIDDSDGIYPTINSSTTERPRRYSDLPSSASRKYSVDSPLKYY